jgi:hypothetical protein
VRVIRVLSFNGSLGKIALEVVQLSNSPSCSCPRVINSVGRFKAGAIGAVSSSVVFDPIVFLCDSLVMKNNSVSPQEVFKVQGASGYVAAFV